ncbi:hypothetical protein AB0I69_39135 [Streptomyces sp. NPDC050508]|uniref:hypothetical protein n=1 Tax=Streptomyces sp. NPDC050508 TaxID=3155405 RepID=UPI0034371B87
MSNLRQRYWASLTDSRGDNLESLDHFIEHGRRKDRPLWRRYLASLFDIELTGKDSAGNSKYSPITEVRSIVVPVRRSWLAIAASVLLVFGAGFGTSFFLSDQRASASPVVIGAAPTLPAGALKEAGGFAWVPPKGWERVLASGTEIHYISPEGNQELVAKSSLARGNLMQTWQASEQNASQAESYRRISFLRATFRGWPAVVWEYSFTLEGVSWHALLLSFDAYGKSYQVNTWYQPKTGVQALKIYSVVKDSFTVL